MDSTQLNQVQSDLKAVATNIDQQFKELAHHADPNGCYDPPFSIDPYRLFSQCSELSALCMTMKHVAGSATHLLDGISLPISRLRLSNMVTCGDEFESLKDLLNGQQKSAWVIRLSSHDQKFIRVHARTCEEDLRLQIRQKHAIELQLETIACSLCVLMGGWYPFTMNLTNHKTMVSYGVLCWYPRPAGGEALAGPDRAIYVRCNVESIWGTLDRPRHWPVFIRYSFDLSKTMQTLASLLDPTEEAQCMGMQVREGRGQWALLPKALPDLSAPAYAKTWNPHVKLFKPVWKTPALRCRRSCYFCCPLNVLLTLSAGW